MTRTPITRRQRIRRLCLAGCFVLATSAAPAVSASRPDTPRAQVAMRPVACLAAPVVDLGACAGI